MGDLKWLDRAIPIQDAAASSTPTSPGNATAQKGDWKSRAISADPEAEPSLGEKALGLVGKVGRFVDTYTGAPTRAAIGAAQEGNNPIPAFTHQFGENPELAPTGKKLAQRAGVPDTTLSEVVPSLYSDTGEGMSLKKGGLLDPSASGVAGLGLDVAADPTNLIPAVGMAKRAIQGTELGAKGAQVAGKVAEAGQGLLKSGALKTGEALTGVPRDVINTYATQTKDVNDLIKRFGPDTASAADEVRQGIQNNVQQTRKALNAQIGDALKKASPEKVVDISPVLEKLETLKNRLNPNLKEDSVKQIDEIIDKVKNEGTVDGKVNIQSLHEIREFLQDRAKGSYAKNGQIFQIGKDSAQAAKQGAAVARKTLNELAPEIKTANNQLYELHRIEDNLNLNLITPDKPEGALLSVAAGNNPRNAKLLNRLGDLTNSTPIADAKKLAAQKVFAQPSYVTTDFTGKGVERAAKGAVIGGLIGHKIGVGYIPGAIAGGLLTSPAALKTAIQAGQISSDVATQLLKAPEALQNPVIRGLLQGARVNSSQGLLIRPRPLDQRK